ncbi:MAG: flagellar hook assembly protein FlgD [Spirochaetales bacterium]
MDGLTFQMTQNDTERLRAQNESFNLALTNQRQAKTELGKDEFLKILMTQLTNQDPTEPMQDREFIAQMAQFSSLEQMTNMADQFKQLGGILQSSQAMGLLGRTVDITLGGRLITGEVTEVTGGEFPQVQVNGNYYDYENVQRVRVDEE